MGIYSGCHCLMMTNGHASSCVARFIYADIIRPLKWNTQWAICQKFKAYLTWSLLQSSFSHALDRFQARCKLGEYSWWGDAVSGLRRGTTWSSEWNTSEWNVPLAVFGTSSRRDLKVRKKFLWFQTSEKEAFSRSGLVEEKGRFRLWKTLSGTLRVLERNSRMPLVEKLEQCACVHFQIVLKTLKGPCPCDCTFILLGLCVWWEEWRCSSAFSPGWILFHVPNGLHVYSQQVAGRLGGSIG